MTPNKKPIENPFLEAQCAEIYKVADKVIPIIFSGPSALKDTMTIKKVKDAFIILRALIIGAVQ